MKNSIELERADATEAMVSLRPTKFSLNFGDDGLADSFLIRNVLQYEWQFTLTINAKPKQHFRDATPERTLPSPPLTNGTRFTYFAPAAGVLAVSVTIRRPAADPAKRDRSDPITIQVPVAENTELSVLKSLQGEFALLAIVFLVTLATSLPALYFSKSTFGSFADYAAILAWAIGVDQGKNLIQMVKAFRSGDTPETRSASS